VALTLATVRYALGKAYYAIKQNREI